MRHITKVIVTIIAVIAVLVLAEFVLRRWVGIDPSTDRMIAYQFDDTLGWKPRGDFKYYRSSLYYGQFNYYNPDGFPTNFARWHIPASTTTPSIAILGSSLTESYYLPYEESFPYLIEQKAKGKQVLNLGVSGYAPDQDLLRARMVLPNYHVTDIVAIFFPLNGLRDIDADRYQGFAKPHLDLALSKPINVPLQPPPLPPAEKGIIAGIRNTAIYTLLRPFVRKGVGLSLRVSTKQSQRFDPEQMEKVFHIFARLHEEHPDARLVIYMVPFYREIGDRELYQSNLALYEATCTKHGLTCASMDPVIAAHPNTGDIFIEGDGHLTAYGAKLIADQLTEILSTPSLNGSGEVSYK